MRGDRSLRRAVALLAACLLLASAGCDGDADPGPSTASGESSPSAEPSDPATPREPAEPTLPPAAQGASPKAAKAFVRYYVDVFNHARTTGETSHLLNASRRCAGCRAYARLYTKQYALGGSNKTQGWNTTNITLQQGSPGYVALVSVHAAPLKYRESRDSTLERYGSENYAIRLELASAKGSWAVSSFRGAG